MPTKDLQDLSDERVGERIRFFRQERGLTQEQLGLAIGAGTPQSAKATIAKIERGQVPGGKRLHKLATALQCSADILLSGMSRELFEVIRYVVRPVGKLEPDAHKVFRAARIFLHFAFASGDCGPQSAFVEAANRLFFLAERDPKMCHQLLKRLPRGDMKQVLASEDLRALIRSTMQEAGADPDAYERYDFAAKAIGRVRTHFTPSQAPSLAADEGEAQPAPGADAAGGPALPVIEEPANAAGVDPTKSLPAGGALVRIEGDGMEPLAGHGQYAIVADGDRTPVAGDLVVCWSSRKGLLFGRLLEPGEERSLLFAIAPTAHSRPVPLERDEIQGMRVIVGVLYE